MKIAIDARILRTTTGRYVDRLLHYLQQIDHTNQYVVLLTPNDFDTWTPTNPNFTKKSIDVRNYSISEQTKLVQILHSLRVDLVHFAMPQQPLLYFGPSITTIHDLTLLHFKNYEDNSRVAYDTKQKIFRQVMYYAAHKSRIVLVPTEYTKQDVIKTLHANPDKVKVTYEAADEIKKGEETPIAELANLPFIMYAGRKEPFKNIRRLIEAQQQLLQIHPDLQLALPGPKDGSAKVIEKWCRDRRFKQVHFLGFVSDAQLRWLFENARAYAFPSLSEGFGLPPLEAMTYGTPVVSSNATCLPEVCKDGAHYFDPLSVDDIADKINDVLSNSKLRKDLIRAGHNVVRQYSWKRMAQETLNAYEKAVRQ
jgi:glycosyltransferase involved in cell wall biosynthesis